MDSTEIILRNFLNLHWIRPEVAIWRTLDALQMKKMKFQNPIIDLGCGDGTFSFTNFGGRTSNEFDVFRAIKKTDGFFDGKDIHDQKTSVKPKLNNKPKQSIDVGIDWKKSLLDKAEKLQFYKLLKTHDLNKKLPFEDSSFKTLFSNIFYWIPKIDSLLKESNRIVSEEGKIILLVPDEKLKENLIYSQYLKHGYAWAKILDRGIYKNITKHAYSFKKWKQIFAKADLKIINHNQYLSPQFIKFWSVGMRPYSPYMIEMSNKLAINERTKLKKRVIEDTIPILKSYIKTEINSPKNNNCFHFFVLKKLV